MDYSRHIKRWEMKRVIVFIGLWIIVLPALAAADFFNQPQRLCSALVADGLHTSGWKSNKAGPGEWSCMTKFVPFGTAGANGMENNISFYVNGASSSRVKDIRIKVNINNANERNQAFIRLNSAAKLLFKTISQPIPPELSKAIAQQTPVTITSPFGKIELIFKPGQMDSVKVVLAISPQSLSSKKRVGSGSMSRLDNHFLTQYVSSQ